MILVQRPLAYQKKLYQERDITIILGEDWDKSSNLVQCNNPIN